ncbi:hypothetical protein [Sphingomonas oleivorans]|uniref:hypothetical protein n=1 Tax=Sphingomonas oleivorans TaxID=1735121 RepID=UPI0013FD2EF7|nr:hypothetical protein [Sphingomonas oleivorans]
MTPPPARTGAQSNVIFQSTVARIGVPPSWQQLNARKASKASADMKSQCWHGRPA